MATVGNIFDYLNRIAPVRMMEEYDNVGLLVGDRNQLVTKVLIALDITGKVVDKAAAAGAQLIVSHHPVIFRPIRDVRLDGKTGIVYKLANHSLSAVCMHTNLDLANGGVNDCLAQTLELADVEILSVTGKKPMKKITVFVPVDYAAAVRQAMTDAGAGSIQNYRGCAFETQGMSYFRPVEGSNPFIGEVGKVQRVYEMRIEALCPGDRVEEVVRKVISVHPYEVPVYHVTDDEAMTEPYGIGRVGNLAQPKSLEDFAGFVKQKLFCSAVGVCRSRDDAVRRISVCGGADDGTLVEFSLKAGADTLVIGEMKHSSKIEAKEAGVNIIEAGHFQTENVICPHLFHILSSQFRDTVFSVANHNCAPDYFI
ncbi:MAG TPA: Nif3-like dinuclear metal center hexameric protein [Clostridia bacterium]|nr:Nif3-like dinuclear metal center hexameric protein [Clostridia bacterium]